MFKETFLRNFLYLKVLKSRFLLNIFPGPKFGSLEMKCLKAVPLYHPIEQPLSLSPHPCIQKGFPM